MAEINAEIPLAIKQQPTLFQSMGDLYQLQNQQLKNQSQNLSNQLEQQAFTQLQQRQSPDSTSAGNSGVIAPIPNAVPSQRSQLYAIASTQPTQPAAQPMHAALLQGVQYFKDAKDQRSWDEARNHAQANGFDNDSHIPAVYDPSLASHYAQLGTNLVNQIGQQAQRATNSGVLPATFMKRQSA